MKISFQDSLAAVVRNERCVGCAACVSVCPIRCLDYVIDKPELVKECNECGICARICPRYEFDMSTVEETVFGRQRKKEEAFGIYQNIVISQATDEKIRKVGQDGGVASALMSFALEAGMIDGAATSGISQVKPFFPIPKLALTSEDVLACAGTRYTYSPNILAFREGFAQKKKSLAFVGVPCQIQAVRQIESLKLKFIRSLQFSIGLFCTESFTYKGLMKEHVEGELGVELSDIEKINIKGKILVSTKSGEVKSIPLKEVKRYTRKSCEFCTDFSAELADISVGGLGLDGWTFTILRTEKGEKIFNEAVEKGFMKTKPVEEEQRAYNLLLRLTKVKRARSSS